MSTVYQTDIVDDPNLATEVLADRISDLRRSGINHARLFGENKTIRLRVAIPDVDPLLWLDMQNNTSRVYWASRDSEFETAGVGVADHIGSEISNDADAVISHIREMIPSDTPDLRYFGGFRFSCGGTLSDDNPWHVFGGSRFVLPRFELYRRSHETYLACNLVSERDLDILSEVLTELEAISFLEPSYNDHIPKWVCPWDVPERDQWQEMVADI